MEIIQAIKSLKNGKSPGADNRNAELLIVDSELAANTLLPLYTNIWVEKKIPPDWTKGVIVKVPRKAHYRIATIGGASHFFLFPAKYSVKSLHTVLQQQWTRYSVMNKPVLGK